VAVLTLVPCFASPTDEISIAYRVKAGYLFNFLKFAEWPDAALPPAAPLRIAIAADDAIYALLATALEGKVVNGRTLVVLPADGTEIIPPPHLLFVTQTAAPAVANQVSGYNGQPVLTIGESPNFARRHGILNFVLVDDAIRFEVNLSTAQRAGLRISSRISKLAILVRPSS
jgi:hypothetical protein